MHLLKIISKRIYRLTLSEAKEFMERHKNNDVFTEFERNVFLVDKAKNENFYTVLNNRNGNCEFEFFISLTDALAYMLNLNEIKL